MKVKVIVRFMLFRGHQTTGYRRFAKAIELPNIPPMPFTLELISGEIVSAYTAEVVVWSEPENGWQIYCEGPNAPTQAEASQQIRKAIDGSSDWTLVQKADWQPR